MNLDKTNESKLNLQGIDQRRIHQNISNFKGKGAYMREK